MDSVVEPNPQAHIGIGPHAGREGRHIRERSVAQQHRVEAIVDGEGDRRGGLRAERCFGVPSLLQNVVLPFVFTRANLKEPAPLKFRPPTATRPW